MKLLGGRNKKPQGQDDARRPLRRQKRESDSYRIGRTIAGEAFADERKAKLERLKERKKTKRKNFAVVFGVVLIVVLIGVVFGHYIADIAAENQAKREIVKVSEPTVEIRDENADTEVSARVKLFVARLEDDVREYGYAVDYVVLPLNKVREMHIFLRDRKEYYKMTVERGSAVQAEDMERMIRYLDSKKINATYVDLRVEGKAFYK